MSRAAHHLRTCTWFWAWAAVGVLATLSLDPGLGPLTAVPALVLGIALATATSNRSGGSLFGLVTGAGLPLLLVAYVQRQGPGTTCWHTATAMACDQHLNPLPWLIAGVILVLAGLIGHSFARYARCLPASYVPP